MKCNQNFLVLTTVLVRTVVKNRFHGNRRQNFLVLTGVLVRTTIKNWFHGGSK